MFENIKKKGWCKTMSQFTRFMKKNKIQKENTTYAATKSLTDEKGEPLLWTIKPLSTKENEAIRDECMVEVPVKGKPNMFRTKLNTSKYLCEMLVACVAEPNLYDKELQDSYGVMTPEDLLQAMVDDPGEYQDFVAFVQEFNGFTTLEEKVDEVKN